MLKPLICVLLMVLVTYLPRMLPITIFRKEIKSNYMKSFLHYVPYAVLGSLTFPDIFYSSGNSSKAIICAAFGTAVALFLAYKEKGLVFVATGAVAITFLAGLVF